MSWRRDPETNEKRRLENKPPFKFNSPSVGSDRDIQLCATVRVNRRWQLLIRTGDLAAKLRLFIGAIIIRRHRVRLIYICRAADLRSSRGLLPAQGWPLARPVALFRALEISAAIEFVLLLIGKTRHRAT
jgi:hypothetical protein